MDVNQPPTSYHDEIYDLSVDDCWKYLATGTFDWRAFAVAGPSVWNLLPDYLRDPAVGRNTFRKQLKTFIRTLLMHAAH